METRRREPGLADLIGRCTRRDFLGGAGKGAALLALSGGGLSALLDACGAGGGVGTALAANQTLRAVLTTEPGTLDINLQQWVYEAEVGRQMFETLLKPRADLSDVQLAAAASYQVSADGLTYTFKLRPDASWSDGQPVVAQDFVYAWKRILNPKLAAPYADPFWAGNVKGAERYSKVSAGDSAGIASFLGGLGLSAPDKHTFRVELQHPAPYFKWVATLWMGAPVRKDVVEKYGEDKWATSPTSLVSNGVLKVSEIVPKDHVTLVPNPHYWGGKPHLTKVRLDVITDENAAYARYQNGELDMVHVPLSDAKAVSGNAETHKEPELVTFWVDFNNKRPPFDNPKVRMAFAKAFDREALVNDVLVGQGIPTSAFIPKGMKGYEPSLGDPQKFDPAAAKKLLAESGVPPARLNGIQFLFRNTPDNQKLAEFFQAQFKKNLGVSVTLNGLESKTVSKFLGQGNYDMSAPQGWGADYPDQQDWFDIFITGSGNQFNNYSNPRYDQLVKQADQDTDSSKRDSLYKQAQRLLIEDAPSAFAYQRTYWILIKKYVKGVQATPIDDYPFAGDFHTDSISIGKH